jgi:ORF 12 gene product N-terminal
VNWFGLHSGRHRRVSSASGLARDGATQPAVRKVAGRIVCAGLSVVLAGAAAGCTDSPGSTGQGQAATAASLSLFISRTAPDAPVGRQLTWFLRAMADLPWSQQVIKAHFDSSFLAGISPEKLNSSVPQILAAWGASVPSSGAPVIGLLSEDPARDRTRSWRWPPSAAPS